MLIPVSFSKAEKPYKNEAIVFLEVVGGTRSVSLSTWHRFEFLKYILALYTEERGQIEKKET